MAFNDYSLTQPIDPLEEERKRREQELANLQFGLPTETPAAPVNPQDLANIQQMQNMPTTQVAGPTQIQAPAVPAMPDQTDAETQRLLAQQQQAMQQPQVTTPPTGEMRTMAPTTTPEPPAPVSFDKAFTEAQSDRNKLWEIYNSSQYTPEQRQLAGKQVRDLMAQEYEKDKATQFVRTATDQDLVKMMSSRNQEGNWGKAILYGLLGMEQSQKDEAAKLGIGAKWTTQQITDPKTGELSNVMVKMRADGLPMEGYNIDTQKALSAKELAGAVGSQLGKQVSTTAETYVDPTTGERYRSQTDERGNARLVNIQTGARFTGSMKNLQRQTDVSSMARVDYGLATDLLKKHSGNVLDMMKEYETIKGPMTPEGRAEFMQRYGYGTTVPGAATQTAVQTTTTPPADKAAALRLEGDIAGLQREINQPKQANESPQAYQTRQSILKTELAKAQQQHGQLVGTGGVQGGAISTQGIAGMKGAQDVGIAGAKEAQAADIALQKEERSNFLTYEEKDIVPKAEAAGSIASTRKSQLKGPDGILQNPEIVGMLSGQGGISSEVGNIIRDLITGARTDDELSQRVSSLGLTPRQKDVLYNQIQLNRQIAPKTLKENAGAGSVSDAEQKANREAAINITRVPLYTAVTMMSKDQFDKDQQVARQAFRNANPQLTTVRAFNDAWGKEKSRLDREYNQIYEERAKYISKYYQDGKNQGAIVDAYKYYPVPEFNRQTGQWDYGTDYARKAARPKLKSFEN